jgi:DNA helicase HerA-like ATPase
MYVLMREQYMLDNPGSKVLSNYLATLIRLQRHKGVRVVISTQEPTVSTDLIALCSVTVIHRFTSPAWYSALMKHISAMDNHKDIMREIEGLKTGAALVYAPNAVLGKDNGGKVIKATGRLLRVDVRSRITRDGGESIMAV